MENVATHLALFNLNQCIKVVVNHYCRQGVEDDISFIMVIIVEFMKVLFYMIHTMFLLLKSYFMKL